MTAKLLTGNYACAYGARLCHPDLIACYPITPQTPVVEALSRFHAEGTLDSDMVEVESEHSALSQLIGVSLAGGRTFTATSSLGLFFMSEPYHRVPPLRLPIVMAIVGRESDPAGVLAGQQDSILMKEMGWIQLYCESGQEILDTIIMAYRLAEDPDVLLPVNIVYEGFYISHLADRVDVPDQETVDKFLSRKRPETPFRLDPRAPMSYPHRPATGKLLTEYRYKQCTAIENAKKKIDDLDKEFGKIFGRSYGGAVEGYKAADADFVLLTMGRSAGTAKVVVDSAREQGVKLGLVKVRAFRPFPRQRLAQELKGKKAIGVIDQNVGLGWGCGSLFFETKTVLNDLGVSPPIISFIDGLGGADITLENLEKMAEITRQAAASGKVAKEVVWMSLE